MTVHAPSDVRAITVPAERGGCGQPHEADDVKFSVDCPACEPIIAEMRTGWAQAPHAVALTPDEIGVAEAAESQAARARNRTWGDASELAKAFASAIQNGMPAEAVAAPSLLEQIAALSVQERAALAGMLTASVSPEPAGEDEAVAAPPVKRGPGRPRKVVDVPGEQI